MAGIVKMTQVVVFVGKQGGFVMKKEKRIIQVIVKSGLITWVLLLLIWQIGSLFYSDDFLPGPFTTFAGAGKLVASGDLFRDILISMQRVLKGWLLGILFAIPAGLCIGHFKKIGAIFEPFLNFFRFVPAIGFITLFLIRRKIKGGTDLLCSDLSGNDQYDRRCTDGG